MIPCIVDGKPLSARATARSAAHTLMHEFDAINRGHMPECENVLVIASKRFDSNAVEHRDTQRSRLNWYSRAASFAPMFNSKWYAEKNGRYSVPRSSSKRTIGLILRDAHAAILRYVVSRILYAYEMERDNTHHSYGAATLNADC